MVMRGMKEFKERWERVEIRRKLEDIRKREDKWRREKIEIEKRIEDLEIRWEEGLKIRRREKKWEKMEKRVGKLESGDREKGEGEEERIKETERRVRAWEKRERQEKRRNIVIKGIKEEEKNVKIRLKEILEQVGANMEEARMVMVGKEEWGKMAVVKLKTEKDKKKVMEKKGKLKGEKIWIMKDLT